MSEKLRISNKYSDLKGDGLEVIEIDGNVICKFYDGVMIKEDDKPRDLSKEETLIF